MLAILANDITIQADPNILYILLGGVIALLGWIGRQQVRWMGKIETKINRQGTDIEVMKAVMGIKVTTDSTHAHDSSD